MTPELPSTSDLAADYAPEPLPLMAPSTRFRAGLKQANGSSMVTVLLDLRILVLGSASAVGSRPTHNYKIIRPRSDGSHQGLKLWPFPLPDADSLGLA